MEALGLSPEYNTYRSSRDHVRFVANCIFVLPFLPQYGSHYVISAYLIGLFQGKKKFGFLGMSQQQDKEVS